MKLKVRLFARARDLAGVERVELELPDRANVGDLRKALAARFPGMMSLAQNLLVAVGTDYADERTALEPNAEIACFPPVSGG